MILILSLLLPQAYADLRLKAESGEINFSLNITKQRFSYSSSALKINKPIEACSRKAFDRFSSRLESQFKSNNLKWNLQKTGGYKVRYNKKTYNVAPLTSTGVQLAKMDSQINYLMGEESYYCSTGTYSEKSAKKDRKVASSEGEADCKVDEALNEAYKSCMHEICGKHGYRTYDRIPELPAGALDKEADGEKEIEKLAKELYKIDDPMEDKQNVDFLVEYTKKNKIKIEKLHLILMVELISIINISKFIDVDLTELKVSVNKEKLSGFKLDLSERNLNAFKKHIEQSILKLNQYDFFNFDRLSSSDQYFSKKFPNLKKADAVKKMISQIKADLKYLKSTSFGLVLNTVYPIEKNYPLFVIKQIEASKDVTELALRELVSKSIEMAQMRAVYESTKVTKESDFDLTELQSKIFHFLGNVDFLEELFDQKEYDKKLSEVEGKVKACVSAFRTSLLYLPTEQQLSSFNRDLSGLKSQIIKSWSNQYSKEGALSISDYLKKVSFYLPLSVNAYKAGIKGRLQLKVDERKASVVELKDLKDPSSLIIMAAILKYAVSEEVKSSEENEHQSDNDESDLACQVEDLSPLSDGNITLFGKIQTSFTSVQYPILGRAVAAHELGHGIDHIFLNQKASVEDKERHHKLLEDLGYLHPEGSFRHYVQEDYADFVAANVVKENKVCMFVQSVCDNSKLVESKYSFDAHSSSFFRLLHVELNQRGGLPNSCEKVMSLQETPRPFAKPRAWLK